MTIRTWCFLHSSYFNHVHSCVCLLAASSLRRAVYTHTHTHTHTLITLSVHIEKRTHICQWQQDPRRSLKWLVSYSSVSVQLFMLIFLWTQNSDHGQPILSMLRFSKISLQRVCKKGISLVTIALGNHLSLESFFFSVQKRIASWNLISVFIKTSIIKFYHWFAVSICRWVSCQVQMKSGSESIMFSDIPLYTLKKKTSSGTNFSEKTFLTNL